MSKRPDLSETNYALGYADGLVPPVRQRNRPTDDCFRKHFQQGLSDAERRRPFGPPGGSDGLETRQKDAASCENAR